MNAAVDIGAVCRIAGELCRFSIQPWYLPVRVYSDCLKRHEDLSRRTDLRNCVNRVRTTVDDKKSGHTTKELERNGSVLVRVVPECSGLMKVGNLDLERIRCLRRHAAKRIVTNTLRCHCQPMSVEIRRVRFVRECTPAGLFRIRRKTIYDIDSKPIPGHYPECRADETTLVCGRFNSLIQASRNVNERISCKRCFEDCAKDTVC